MTNSSKINHSTISRLVFFGNDIMRRIKRRTNNLLGRLLWAFRLEWLTAIQFTVRRHWIVSRLRTAPTPTGAVWWGKFSSWPLSPTCIWQKPVGPTFSPAGTHQAVSTEPSLSLRLIKGTLVAAKLTTPEYHIFTTPLTVGDRTFVRLYLHVLRYR